METRQQTGNAHSVPSSCQLLVACQLRFSSLLFSTAMHEGVPLAWYLVRSELQIPVEKIQVQSVQHGYRGKVENRLLWGV